MPVAEYINIDDARQTSDLKLASEAWQLIHLAADHWVSFAEPLQFPASTLHMLPSRGDVNIVSCGFVKNSKDEI